MALSWSHSWDCGGKTLLSLSLFRYSLISIMVLYALLIRNQLPTKLLLLLVLFAPAILRTVTPVSFLFYFFFTLPLCHFHPLVRWRQLCSFSSETASLWPRRAKHPILSYAIFPTQTIKLANLSVLSAVCLCFLDGFQCAIFGERHIVIDSTALNCRATN